MIYRSCFQTFNNSTLLLLPPHRHDWISFFIIIYLKLRLRQYGAFSLFKYYIIRLLFLLVNVTILFYKNHCVNSIIHHDLHYNLSIVSFFLMSWLIITSVTILIRPQVSPSSRSCLRSFWTLNWMHSSNRCFYAISKELGTFRVVWERYCIPNTRVQTVEHIVHTPQGMNVTNVKRMTFRIFRRTEVLLFSLCAINYKHPQDASRHSNRKKSRLNAIRWVVRANHFTIARR